MTPLAQTVVRDLTFPVKRRVGFGERAQRFGNELRDAHCFDLSEAMPMVEDLTLKLMQHPEAVGRFGFLPAKKTWLEYAHPRASRVGFLIEAASDNRTATMKKCVVHGGAYHVDTITRRLSLYNEAGSRAGWSSYDPREITPPDGEAWTAEDYEDAINFDPATAFACLALINSPRVIGRRQHMPHRGLERDLTARRKLIGKFPLHAWTEITLEVNAPLDVAGADPAEAHLTGMRALHFCRAHLRVRLGNIEIVREHWRGDPALGIKQSRYAVVPPREARA